MEESMAGNGCMLCDMRDLAQCALVCRSWHEVAQKLLYNSIRIDTVHYCKREVELATKRKRKSFFERNGDPRDAPQQRLRLLARTVRDVEPLAHQIKYLKLSYMTRETCKADLARTVSVLPNLRYVDLPDGFYSGDPDSNTIKHELQSRCPDIRKMRFLCGAEASFTALAQSRIWQNLEVLVLSALSIDPSILLHVLNTLPILHELRLYDMAQLDDQIFTSQFLTPSFPPVSCLIIENIPNITADGLEAYLSEPDNHEALTHLTISNTGIRPFSIHQFLAKAPKLIMLSISERLGQSFPLTPTPPISSRSLHTLHYEILPAPTSTNSSKLSSEAYYAYLSSSIHSGHLPALTSLYVISPSFSSLLLDARTNSFRPASSDDAGPQSPRAGPSRALMLYTKSTPELEWNITQIILPNTHNGGRGASLTRLVKDSDNEQLSPIRVSNDRNSTIVGNGFGGFLAVPTDDGGRLGFSSGHRKKASQDEAWMG